MEKMLQASPTSKSGMQTKEQKWQPTPILLPGESHGGRSLVGCSPWGLKELDRTEQLHFHFQTAQKRGWASLVAP